MKPDQPSREQIEARLTALLLGELPAAEAELLRWNIAQDAELQKLHDQLKLTIGFVREAMKNPADAPMERETPLKLSQERRQTLLAHFKTDRPKPLIPPLRHKMFPLIPTLVVVAIIALLAAMLLPVLNTAKTRGTASFGISEDQATLGIEDKQQITAAANEWNLESGRATMKSPVTVPPAGTEQAATANLQEPTTTPPMARIVLPNTETSQNESQVKAGPEVYSQGAVGYVNASSGASWSRVQPEPAPAQAAETAPLPPLASTSSQVETETASSVPVVEVSPGGAASNPGVSAITPSSTLPQPQPNSESPIVLASPPPASAALPQAETFAFNNAGAAPPASASSVHEATRLMSKLSKAETATTIASAAPQVVAVTPIPGSAPEANGPEPVTVGGAYAVSASSVQEAPQANGLEFAPERLSDGEKTLAIRNRVYSPDAGVNGAVQVTNNTLALAWPADHPSWQLPRQTGSSSGGGGGFAGSSVENRSFSSRLQNVLTYATNGAPSDNFGFGFPDTNVVAMNYGTINGSGLAGGNSDQSESSALIASEDQNAKVFHKNIENSDSLRSVTRNPATGLPETAVVAQGGNAGSVYLPPQSNSADNEMIPPSLIDFQGADVSQVLEVYAQMVGRTLLQSGLPNAQIVLRTETPLTKTQAIKALQGALALNGIAVINVGDKFVKALPVSQAGMTAEQSDKPLTPPVVPAPTPQPEVQTRDNAFSTFSLNVSDVSFKLASASLGNGQMPAPASIRSEEFINAFDYRDPEPLQGQPLSFTSERARDPFAQERDLLRFSIKAAAAGRQEGRALNLVLLLDTSGSMERADRVAIIREALRVLCAQLQPQDTVSVVTFARTARLWADGVPGDQAGATLDKVGSITPEGGTNLEEAMRLAYETALRHFLAGGMNRVVLLTDGAANLGNADPQALTQKVEAERRQGIALDCFGIGWEDYNDDLLEQLSSNGDGRYAFINSPDEAGTEFAAKLAGALQVAAEDVKVQVEFNPDRVTAWRQIGYAKHQLTKAQFRDNTVAAGAIAAREAGNALYVIETRPDGEGPIATVRVRYRVPGTQDNRERSWLVDYTGTAPALAQSSPAMRLAASAGEFSEWLADSPFAQDVTPDELLNYLSGVPQAYGTDERPKQLEWMIRQAKSVSGK